MSPYLNLPRRSYEDAVRETAADRHSTAETIVDKLIALEALIRKWAPDMEGVLHHMDCAVGCAKADVKRLHDELPHYERLPEPSRAL